MIFYAWFPTRPESTLAKLKPSKFWTYPRKHQGDATATRRVPSLAIRCARDRAAGEKGRCFHYGENMRKPVFLPHESKARTHTHLMGHRSAKPVKKLCLLVLEQHTFPRSETVKGSKMVTGIQVPILFVLSHPGSL